MHFQRFFLDEYIVVFFVYFCDNYGNPLTFEQIFFVTQLNDLYDVISSK
jgi:hypothetical protein